MNRKRSHPACSGSAYPERIIEQEKYFTLYTRYQTTHEHAFSNCLSDLLKLRAERRKAEKDEAALLELDTEPPHRACAPRATQTSRQNRHGRGLA